jgi:catechol 2,3-dioxygenase
MAQEPVFDVAQLAHVEMLTPNPEGTLWFFKDLLGLQESGRENGSVYLRAYEDFYHHTLKVTEAREGGLGHVAWRTTSPQALERRVGALEASGLGKGWVAGDTGHGPAYRFTTPDGHLMELFWEVEYYHPPADKQTGLLNRPQKRPLTGVPARRIDHVNLLAANVTATRDFLMDVLGFRLRENIMLDNGVEAGAWLSVSPLVHAIAVMGDQTGRKGRFHHVCYWWGYPQHLMDMADIFSEYGIHIEAGPGKHGISQAWFMYVYEPGGNRVELFGDTGYLIFDPAWKPITWREAELERAAIWYGSPLPAEFFLYGTPRVEGAEQIAERGEQTEELTEAIAEAEQIAQRVQSD